MAQKRMFSKKITHTDAFVNMPLSSRLLYYELNMEADDDGFVDSPIRIMRMIGCSQDDMNVLIGKKFVIPFDSGICVIKHWLIHNTIRKDRYTPTNYIEEKEQLQLKENNAYTLNGNQMATTGMHRLEEISIDKNRLEENNKERHLEYVLLTDDEYDKLVDKLGNERTNEMIERLNNYIGSKGKKYKSHYHTILVWAKKDKGNTNESKEEYERRIFNK